MLDGSIVIIYGNNYIYNIKIEDETQQNNDCSICMENENNIHLIPCGHKMCYSCLVSLAVDNKLECPYCNQRIIGRIPIYDKVLTTANREKIEILTNSKLASGPRIKTSELMHYHPRFIYTGNDDDDSSSVSCYEPNCDKKRSY